MDEGFRLLKRRGESRIRELESNGDRHNRQCNIIIIPAS